MTARPALVATIIIGLFVVSTVGATAQAEELEASTVAYTTGTSGDIGERSNPPSSGNPTATASGVVCVSLTSRSTSATHRPHPARG